VYGKQRHKLGASKLLNILKGKNTCCKIIRDCFFKRNYPTRQLKYTIIFVDFHYLSILCVLSLIRFVQRSAILVMLIMKEAAEKIDCTF
jgi:hypothetical protein